MIHNDVLRSVRYMLDISDKKVIEITKTGGMEIALEDLVKYLDKKEEDEEGFVRCPDEVIAHFLDGHQRLAGDGRIVVGALAAIRAVFRAAAGFDAQ